MAKIVAIWGVVAIASAIIGGLVASAKGRDHSLPPMLLILLVMPSHKGPRPRRPGIDEIEDRQAF